MSERADNAYDVIVIGAGPVGYTIADRARAAGLSVAAVELELVGGECSYWACIPSKAMLRPVVAVADARRVAGAREAVTGMVDAPAVFARRDQWVTDWNDEGQAAGLKSTGAELIRGHGRLDGHRRVAVEIPEGGTAALTARYAVVICTGSRTALPELAGWPRRAPGPTGTPPTPAPATSAATPSRPRAPSPPSAARRSRTTRRRRRTRRASAPTRTTCTSWSRACPRSSATGSAPTGRLPR